MLVYGAAPVSRLKVVLEANTSLLKRSGNCLNDLQENFEAAMEEFEGVRVARSPKAKYLAKTWLVGGDPLYRLRLFY